jgi:peptidoglycan-associated lipoprotein
MTRSNRVTAVIVALSLAVSLGACAKKKRTVTDEEMYGADGGRGAAGEERLSDRSSLERYRRGLGPEEGGVLKDVSFDYDSSELSGEARDVLAANAEWLKENRRARTEIEGHCDERGTVEYNLALGARRAKAAKDYLVSLGVEPDRLSTISYGEELPLCREPDESCYARNRRVHFVPPSE